MNQNVKRPPRTDRWWPLATGLGLLLVSLALLAVTAIDAVSPSRMEELFCEDVQRLRFERGTESEDVQCTRLEGDGYRCDVSIEAHELVVQTELFHYELPSSDLPSSYVLIERGEAEWRAIPRRTDSLLHGEIGIREGVLCGELQDRPFALVADSLTPLRDSERSENSWSWTFFASFGSGPGFIAWILLLLAMPFFFLWRQRS